MFEPLQHSYAATFCWGFVLIVSWIGAGSLVRAVLRTRPQQHVDWALLAGWGLAAHAAVGGALMLLGLAHRPVLFGLVVIPALYQVVVWAIRARGEASPDPGRASVSARLRWVFVAVVALPLVLNYASQVSRRAGAWTDNDDYVAYLPFLQRIFDTGSLIEPFNMRRLAAYGGHSLLQAESIVLGSGRHAILLERGIGPILIAGLLWGIFRPRTVFQFVVASGLTVVLALFPLPRANSHANATGVVAFLTLVRTLMLPDPEGSSWRGRALVVGLVLAGACSLRANYVAPAVLGVILAYAGRALTDRANWRRELVDLVVAGAVALVLLVPWMLLLYRSSGTPFYPVFRGNEDPDVKFLGEPLTTLELIEWVARMMAFPIMAAVCAPVVLVLSRRHLRDVLPVYVATIAGALLVAAAFTTADAPNLARYSAPPVFACCAAALAVATSDPTRPRLRAVALAALVVGFVAGSVYMYPTIHKAIARRVSPPTESGVIGGAPLPPIDDPLFDPETRSLYERAQQAIPAGEKALAAVDYPFFFDYARNDVQTLDGSGVCSPPPGMPVFDGPQGVKRYLLDLGIAYVIATDFDRAEVGVVRRRYWQRPDHEMDRPQLPHRPYHLSWMDCADALAGSEVVVFREGNLRVICLR